MLLCLLSRLNASRPALLVQSTARVLRMPAGACCSANTCCLLDSFKLCPELMCVCQPVMCLAVPPQVCGCNTAQLSGVLLWQSKAVLSLLQKVLRPCCYTVAEAGTTCSGCWSIEKAEFKCCQCVPWTQQCFDRQSRHHCP